MRNKYYKKHKDLIKASIKKALERSNDKKVWNEHIDDIVKQGEKDNRVKRILESIQGDFDEN